MMMTSRVRRPCCDGFLKYNTIYFAEQRPFASFAASDFWPIRHPGVFAEIQMVSCILPLNLQFHILAELLTRQPDRVQQYQQDRLSDVRRLRRLGQGAARKGLMRRTLPRRLPLSNSQGNGEYAFVGFWLGSRNRLRSFYNVPDCHRHVSAHISSSVSCACHPSFWFALSAFA